MCDFFGFQDISWAKTEFEILSSRHLINKPLNVSSKIGYFGVTGVKLHTDAHFSRMSQNTLEMKYQKSKFRKISEPDQMSLLVMVKSPILLHKYCN